MVGWGRRKDGRPYRKRSRNSGISFDLPPDPKKPTKVFGHYYPNDDDKKRDPPKSLTKKERKNARFDRVATLNLGSARQFLILTTPILVQMDPHLATLYSTWKFGKYGYGIYQKVKREYDVNGDYPQALQNVVEQEIEEKVISKIKSIPIKNISQFAANTIWEYHKEQNPESTISPEWGKLAVNAMTKTFEEIGEKAL